MDTKGFALKGRRFAFLSHYDFNLYRFRLPLMRALLERGALVWAIAPPGEYGPRFREHGIKFMPIELDRKTFNPLRAWGTVERLTKVLEEFQPHLLHAFTLRPNVYGALAGRRARVPRIICTVTGLGTLYTDVGLKRRLARLTVEFVTRWALRAADAVVFQNPDDQHYYLKRRLCAQAQTHLIVSSGVDIEEFDPQRITQEIRRSFRQHWKIAPQAVVVTMIARMIKPKGVREFLEAALRLRERAQFVLIGEPDRDNPASLSPQEIERYAQERMVLLPGHQQQIAEWLAISDIYVLPSYREGTPRTVLEAMAMGLPVVVTDVPGCRETVINRENGFLIPLRDVESLVRALERLIEDSELRTRMGQCSRRLAVEHFSLEKVVGEYLALYRRLLPMRVAA